ncbi:glutathione S-transferase family protein [Geminicoccus flavidas]|uniref:glutathione S-transferase family protein n=1 Tax=Geminicoccus flavidas TaxID=2506407 RepID=UPI0013589205|nr:glutathione S-transferase family protein [Geminicoccus flavidas]
MTPILFYGVPEGCSFGSIVALEWLGQPYRLCRILMPEQVSGPKFRQVNPLGETPVLLTEDGRLLAQSMAILNHLAARGIDRGLGFPPGSADFDRLNEMLAFLNTSFFSAFSPLWHVLEHGLDDSAGATLTRWGREQVATAHAQLETLLAGRDWLLGERPSLADAYFAGIARWADFHRAVDRRDYPGLDRLLRRLADDPAVRFAHAVEYGLAATSAGGFEGEVTLDQALRLVARSGAQDLAQQGEQLGLRLQERAAVPGE